MLSFARPRSPRTLRDHLSLLRSSEGQRHRRGVQLSNATPHPDSSPRTLIEPIIETESLRGRKKRVFGERLGVRCSVLLLFHRAGEEGAGALGEWQNSGQERVGIRRPGPGLPRPPTSPSPALSPSSSLDFLIRRGPLAPGSWGFAETVPRLSGHWNAVYTACPSPHLLEDNVTSPHLHDVANPLRGRVP